MTSDQSQRTPLSGRRLLRALLASPTLLVAPGVFDGLSALIAQQAGFDAVYVSGGAIARSTGVPDLGLLTMTEVLARIREVVDAVDVPVVADADTGYGGVLNVRRTVVEMERLGIAGLHLEDQITPKKCGHYAAKSLIPTGEMVGKIRAALDARIDPDLLVIARTDAIAVEGFDAALARAGRYAAAGADAVFVEAPQTMEQLERIPTELDVPAVLNIFAGGRTPYLSATAVQDLGYAMMIAPSDLQRAAIRAMQATAQALRAEGSTSGVSELLATFAERDSLVGLDRHQRLADRYQNRDGAENL